MDPFKFEIWLGFIWLGKHAWKIESVRGRQAEKITGTGPPERCEFFCSRGPVLVSWTRVINSTTSRRSSGRDLKPNSPSNLTTEMSVSHWLEFWRRKILGLQRIILLPGNLQGRKRPGFIMLSVTTPSHKWLHSIPSPLQSFHLLHLMGISERGRSPKHLWVEIIDNDIYDQYLGSYQELELYDTYCVLHWQSQQTNVVEL